MSAISSLFEQAQLAEAAYANFWNSATNNAITDPELVKKALQDTENGGSFSATQAAEFVQHWRVVHQLPDTSNKGFSATVFEGLDRPGEFSLAIRGSTPDQSGVDFLADAKLIVTDGVAVSLYGSGGNDLIRGLGGNDHLIDTHGGQDQLEGGEGDTWAAANDRAYRRVA